MQKVLVIGSCGSGKSAFSRRLAEIIQLPLIHLDSHYWRPGWIEPTKDVWREQVVELLKGERWIIDGNYSGTMDMRLAACDTVLFLDLPRHVCTWRVLKRAARYRGRTRPDLAEGCPEKIDLAFLKWTWSYPTRSRPKVLGRLKRVEHTVEIITFRTAREVDRFLVDLEIRSRIPNGKRSD